jgi:hypothetical protein
MVLIQRSIAASDFPMRRGHSRSTSILVPSRVDGRRYARFRLTLLAEILRCIAMLP